MSTPRSLDGGPSTILITGASSGLGAEMARQLAALGHDLALCARRTDRLDALRSEISDQHPDRTVLVRPLDVTDPGAVLTTVRAFRDDFAALGRPLDRVVVNAGLGKGAPLGTGRPEANLETATTNFLGALAQTEAAMEVFRAQGHGHLVMVSSIAAMRGMPGTMTTYGATKAGVAALAEGVRTEVHGKPGFRVTVLYPGYIESELSAVKAGGSPLVASTGKGVAAIVDAVLKEKPRASVPPWPWRPLGFVLRHAPLGVVRRMV